LLHRPGARSLWLGLVSWKAGGVYVGAKKRLKERPFAVGERDDPFLGFHQRECHTATIKTQEGEGFVQSLLLLSLRIFAEPSDFALKCSDNAVTTTMFFFQKF